MSDQVPLPERAIAATKPSRRSRLGRYRPFLIYGGIGAGIAGLTWFLMPGAAKKEETYHQQPRATHSEYVPPVAVPVTAVIQPPPPQPPPMVQPLQPSLLAPRAATDGPAPPKSEPRPAVYSYASTAMPEYMKPKPAPTTSANGIETTGGIAFKPASFEGTKSFTIPHRDYLLMRWTTMICVMDTQIITGASGVSPVPLPHEERRPVTDWRHAAGGGDYSGWHLYVAGWRGPKPHCSRHSRSTVAQWRHR